MKLRLLFSSLLCIAFLGLNGQTIGLIGSATPGGWDADTNMVKHPDSAHLWTLDITLVDGAAKFRKDDSWDSNWGSSDFPIGIGTQDGSDIPVFAGDYTITFDTLSGAYTFSVASVVGLIGDAIAGTEWSEDVNMYEDTSGVFFLDITLLNKNVKFRKDDAWEVAWGSDTFPSGIATTDGGDIAISKSGDYHVTFDTTSGFFNFEEMVTYASIGIIGDATPGGWDVDSNLTQDSEDPNVWTTNITLTEGAVKFRANDAWDINWGGGEFPMDTAVADGDDIVAIPGEYAVSFNTETLIYNFTEIVTYGSIGIIGDAVDGWDAEQDRNMIVSESDSAQWSLRTILGDGEMKFRADDGWDVSWGSGDFPSGIANTGANIPITAGEYVINFNTTTREYTFIELVIYDSVSIVGSATGIDDGNSGWDSDIFLNKDAEDEQLWTLSPVTLVEGECKFRVNADWAVNWGDASFPSGVGVQDGDNIPVPAGSYFVSMRTDDAAYSFQEPSSVHTQSILKDIKIYPNPSDHFINIEMSSEMISGKVNIEIIDVTGKRVSIMTTDANTNVKVDVSSLIPGNYFVKMYNKSFLVAKPISVK